ncbi:hypothetical protein ACI0FW_00612 [Alcaligenes nematophilus]
MPYPNWMYQDPSKHVDFVRRKRKEHQERQPEAKRERAREGLKALFGEGGHAKTDRR